MQAASKRLYRPEIRLTVHRADSESPIGRRAIEQSFAPGWPRGAHAHNLCEDPGQLSRNDSARARTAREQPARCLGSPAKAAAFLFVRDDP